MRDSYRLVLSLALAAGLAGPGFAALSERESNSIVGGSAIFTYGDPLQRFVQEYSIYNPSVADTTANQNTSLANPLPLNDEIVGQLKSTRDYDFYYVDITDTQHPVTPVYFGCDKTLGFYYESLVAYTPKDNDLAWQIEYYYDADPSTPGDAIQQASYAVYPSNCGRGSNDIKGPFRFQMNTQSPGRYYVRVWGKLVASGQDLKENITVNGQSAERHTYYDIIVTPTADYSLRIYTARVSGEMEPNDGLYEAFGLTPGQATPGQLSSMYDTDVFYVDNDAITNTSGRTNLYFSCKGQSGSTYLISTMDYLGIVQNSYQVSSALCNTSDGFGISIFTPISARYYIQVKSPTYSNISSFSQADYTITVLTKGARLPGEQEPNETRENAFPLSRTESIAGQLHSASDLDYYYLDVALSKKTPRFQTLYFTCDSNTDPASQFVISTYNSQGSLQQNYTVSGSRCIVTPITSTAAAKKGFSFQLPTPNDGRYYVLVAGPANKDTTAYSNDNYSLSTFLDVASQMTATNNGRIVDATLTDNAGVNRDNFIINLAKCGERGQLRLVGRRLNLGEISESTQVLVQVGDWSCLTGATPLSQTGGSTYVYPPPAEISSVGPPARPQITGRN